MEIGRPKLHVCYAVIALSWASVYFYTSTLATYAASQGASGSMIGAIMGGFGLTLMLGRAPAGMLSDYLGSSRGIIIAGMLAAVISPLGMLLFPTPTWLLCFRALSGLTAAIWPVLSVTVVSYFPPDRAPEVISKCSLANAAGNTVGMLTGGFLVAAFAQRGAFIGAACLGLIALLLSLRMPERRGAPHTRVTLGDMLHVAGHARLLFLSGLVTLFQIVITGTAMSFTSILAKGMGASAGELGMLSTLSMVGMLLSSMASEPWKRWLGGVRNATACAFLLLGITTALMGFCGNLLLLDALQLLQGFGGYLVMVILMGDSLLPYGMELRGAASGIFQSIFGAGICLGPVLSGILYDLMPIPALYLVLSGLAFAAGMAVLLWYKRVDTIWRQA